MTLFSVTLTFPSVGSDLYSVALASFLRFGFSFRRSSDFIRRFDFSFRRFGPSFRRSG
ncbi:hypothetical protein ACVWXS_003247, partial [Lysinibacillus sp. TE18511]